MRVRQHGAVFCVLAVWLLLPAASAAAQTAPLEGAARGFPAMWDAGGEKLAEGDFQQWMEGDRLHIRVLYDFGAERRIEERAVLRQRPRLVQDAWSWREMRGGELFRQFEVDFDGGRADARKRENGEFREWSEEVDIEPGRTFAGIGFTMAIKAHHERLTEGEEVELEAVGFTPGPRNVTVRLSYGGRDQLRMGGRQVQGDRFVIEARVPWLARLFVDVPDTHIWLTTPPVPAFLRWEGPLAQPDDPVVRVDLLPGDATGPAQPVQE